MHDVVVLPNAEADLDSIATYTKDAWGTEQARTYLATIRADMQSLGEFPMRHPLHEGAAGPFRKARSGQHHLYYQIGKSGVTVVRVLHERMESGEALD